MNIDEMNLSADNDKRVADILTHCGDNYAKFGGAVVPPIYQTSLFVRPSDVNGIESEDYVYTRVSNPTTEIAESKIAALEFAENAACFSSGMGAISSAIMHFIKKDSHIICVDQVYGPTRNFLSTYLQRFGVETTFVSGEDISDFENALKPNTSLIYLESPSSIIFTVQNLEAVAKLAKSRGIGTIIDNSYSTPIYQTPLKFGIDIVVHTASKYLGGHSDIVAGVVISSNEIINQIKSNERELYGNNMDPHASWLLIRGLRTLAVRVKAHSENAEIVAKFLETNKKVEKVFYTGLKNHPQKDLIDKQMSGSTGLMSFIITGDNNKAEKFVNNLKYFQKGCSWGGFESLVTISSANRYDKHIIRIHVGLESTDTLIQDLTNAFSLI